MCASKMMGLGSVVIAPVPCHAETVERNKVFLGRAPPLPPESSVLASGEAGEIEARPRRYDGDYRWFLFPCRTCARQLWPHHSERNAIIGSTFIAFRAGT